VRKALLANKLLVMFTLNIAPLFSGGFLFFENGDLVKIFPGNFLRF
jgi:hypothetical protein